MRVTDCECMVRMAAPLKAPTKSSLEFQFKNLSHNNTPTYSP